MIYSYKCSRKFVWVWVYVIKLLPVMRFILFPTIIYLDYLYLYFIQSQSWIIIPFFLLLFGLSVLYKFLAHFCRSFGIINILLSLDIPIHISPTFDKNDQPMIAAGPGLFRLNTQKRHTICIFQPKSVQS